MENENNNTSTTKTAVMDSLKNIKTNIESFAKEANIGQLQDTVKGMVKDARKDFTNLLNKDLAEIKKTFAKEKQAMTNLMAKEVNQAKKFLGQQKKEIEVLQKKLEKIVASKKKQTVTKAKTSVKKVTVKKATAKKK